MQTNASARSGDIALPRWLSRPVSRYVTRSGERWQPETVALVFALVLREHGTIEAVRATARRLADKVCLEQQPKLKELARTVPDDKVIQVALNIINRVCDLCSIGPGTEFKMPEPVIAPRCHMTPMKLAGYHAHKHWKCQHCSHTKPLEGSLQ
ncbi:hypothetical protein [Pseudidiomarina sp.]|uniref:DUF7740 domain-containing protein n=1 Tax=Pseudidiomarina sp. TaxID=2081707 RepID=UPI003A972126